LAPTAVAAEAYVEEAMRRLSGFPQERPDVDIQRELLPTPSFVIPGSGDRATVLVADDNADMRDYLKRLLTPHHEVQTTDDGVTAFSKMRRRRPDLFAQ
jgi:PleD family two-component response regulator